MHQIIFYNIKTHPIMACTFIYFEWEKNIFQFMESINCASINFSCIRIKWIWCPWNFICQISSKCLLKNLLNLSIYIIRVDSTLLVDFVKLRCNIKYLFQNTPCSSGITCTLLQFFWVKRFISFIFLFILGGSIL